MSEDDAVRRFAENLVDELRAAETIRDRDAEGDGERLTLEELATELGLEHLLEEDES